MPIGEYITYQNVKKFFRNKLRKKNSVSVYPPVSGSPREEAKKRESKIPGGYGSGGTNGNGKLEIRACATEKQVACKWRVSGEKAGRKCHDEKIHEGWNW